jgi:hypothetical protein
MVTINENYRKVGRNGIKVSQSESVEKFPTPHTTKQYSKPIGPQRSEDSDSPLASKAKKAISTAGGVWKKIKASNETWREKHGVTSPFETNPWGGGSTPPRKRRSTKKKTKTTKKRKRSTSTRSSSPYSGMDW